MLSSSFVFFQRRRNVAAAAGDESSSSSSSPSDTYGAVANETEPGDVTAGSNTAEASVVNAANTTNNSITGNGNGTVEAGDDVEIPTDSWMDDGAGLEAFVADVVSSHMDVTSGHEGSPEPNGHGGN